MFTKAQCRIFSHTYNPEQQRLGNKVLRQRLRGPALAAYYPQRIGTLKELEEAYDALGLRFVDYPEGKRLGVIEKYVGAVFLDNADIIGN